MVDFRSIDTPNDTLRPIDTTMADINLQAVHDLLVEVAFEAGQMIMAANTAKIKTDTKASGTPPSLSLLPSRSLFAN